MNEHLSEVLASIQALTISGSVQTGFRMKHETQPWGDGGIWSEVRVLGSDSHSLFDSVVEVRADGSEGQVLGVSHVTTLTQQRDELAAWIAANRKEVAA